jgi:hypothetical protein
MTDRLPMDPDTMKLGLLLETAQNHQDLADDSLKRLQAHTNGLDSVVRDELRRALIAEVSGLINEIAQATAALRRLERAARLRSLWSATVLTSTPGVLIAALLWWWLPSPNQIATLRAHQQQLSSAVSQLEQLGGKIDLRRCGASARLCVRVDRRAPSFGSQSDYVVVQGY